jgi:hypothetical protein
VVLIVSMEVAGVLPGETVVEGDAQLTPEGSPALQYSVTVPLKLFFPVTIIW